MRSEHIFNRHDAANTRPKTGGAGSDGAHAEIVISLRGQAGHDETGGVADDARDIAGDVFRGGGGSALHHDDVVHIAAAGAACAFVEQADIDGLSGVGGEVGGIRLPSGEGVRHAADRDPLAVGGSANLHRKRPCGGGRGALVDEGDGGGVVEDGSDDGFVDGAEFKGIGAVAAIAADAGDAIGAPAGGDVGFEAFLQKHGAFDGFRQVGGHDVHPVGLGVGDGGPGGGEIGGIGFGGPEGGWNAQAQFGGVGAVDVFLPIGNAIVIQIVQFGGVEIGGIAVLGEPPLRRAVGGENFAKFDGEDAVVGDGGPGISVIGAVGVQTLIDEHAIFQHAGDVVINGWGDAKRFAVAVRDGVE